MPVLLASPPKLGDDTDENVLVIYEYLKQMYAALQRDAQAANDLPIQKVTLPVSPATPATPTGLTAFGFFKQILVLWDFDPNPAIGRYEVSRSSTAGGTYTVRTHVSGYTFWDPDLNNSETWHYKVRAVLVDGSTFSSLTASTSATTLADDSGVMALLPTAAAAIQAAGTL